MSSFRYYSLVLGAGVAAGVLVGALLRLRRKSPEQIEQQRRSLVNAIGRITHGTVLELQEVAANGEAPQQLLRYRYDVGGASYECAQDITPLRQLVEAYSCQLGVPASVKYDPRNPANSIVIAEGWSGLRH